MDDIEKELEKAGAEVVVESIAADIAAQLDAGRDIGYTAVAGEGGAAVGRAVSETEDKS